MFLLDIATRSGCSGQLQMELALPMRRGDIGCYLGLREETVRRSLSALQVRQIITVNARVVTILNATALQTLIDKALDYRPVGES